MRVTTSKAEIIHLIRAWAALSLAFTILFARGVNSLAEAGTLFIISGLTVGVAFLLHELAHKIVAQHYGLLAEFRSDGKMLLIAIATAFFGIILAAPGAVYISGHAGINRNGKISMAGPLVNIIFAALFLAATFVFGQSMLTQYGKMINAWLALFNMIPFGFFDGAKILKWNKIVYGSMVAASLVLLIV